MGKFSLYDLLGLLLPGVLFLFFIGVISHIYGLPPAFIGALNWQVNIGVSLCFALIIGATLYATNFYLVKKSWYNRLLGMYKHVTVLYLKMKFLHQLMNESLNVKAIEWYGKNIFFNKADFDILPKDQQKETEDLQDEFYDRMYYELEYHAKIEHAKTVQSFHFFFRQTALACIILLLLNIVLFALYFIFKPHTGKSDIFATLLLDGLLFSILFVSARLAQWYRKRMVMKMYWAYFTHLKQI
ncbi:MAG: CRISPR-associated protein Csx27 [Labilibaculum antarcticum]